MGVKVLFYKWGKSVLPLLMIGALAINGCSIGPKQCGVRPPVSDGVVVLAKRGKSYGALIPRKQRLLPDSLEYEWYYRSDGKGTFRLQERGSFRQGVGRGIPDRSKPGLAIRFGPFFIGWSGHTDGEGFLYYDRCAGERVSPDDLRLCVTKETDIQRIDATDPKWLYKASPVDPGVRASRHK